VAGGPRQRLQPSRWLILPRASVSSRSKLRGLLEQPITPVRPEGPAGPPAGSAQCLAFLVGVKRGSRKTPPWAKAGQPGGAQRLQLSASPAAGTTFRRRPRCSRSRSGESRQRRCGDRQTPAPQLPNPAGRGVDAIGAGPGQGAPNWCLSHTPGRCRTKHNLMEELAKVRRIIEPAGASAAALESLLVLECQPGVRMACARRWPSRAPRPHRRGAHKLDGSARGGVPWRGLGSRVCRSALVGAGEGIGDLRRFNSFEFV